MQLFPLWVPSKCFVKCHLHLSTCFSDVWLLLEKHHWTTWTHVMNSYLNNLSMFLNLQISQYDSKYSSPCFRQVCFIPWYPWMHSTRQESKCRTHLAKNIKGNPCGSVTNADGWLQISTSLEQNFTSQHTTCIKKVHRLLKDNDTIFFNFKECQSIWSLFFFLINKYIISSTKQGTAILAELNAESPNLNFIWKSAHELKIVIRITMKAWWTG